MTAGEWVQLAGAVATIGLLAVTYGYLRATQNLVKATNAQVRLAKRAWLVVERFPSYEFVEHRLFVRNYGKGPAMHVWVYCPITLFGGSGPGSGRARVTVPLRPDILYEIPIGSGSQKEGSSAFVPAVTDMLVEPDRVQVKSHASLPKGTLGVLTYEDVDGEKHWLRYFGVAGDHRQEDGDGEPPWL